MKYSFHNIRIYSIWCIHDTCIHDLALWPFIIVMSRELQRGSALNCIICPGGDLVTKLCRTLAIPWTVVHQVPVQWISQARVLEWTAFAFSTMIYEILVILDSRSTMIDPKEPLNSESPLLCFKQRKIMLYTQKAHGSGPTHPKACSVV